MKHIFVRLSTIVMALTFIVFVRGTAQWSTDPTVNSPISKAVNAQNLSCITYDGSGGAIIAWIDLRNGSTSNIFAQRIDATGAVRWTTDGVPVSRQVVSTAGVGPCITSDTLGGAIIAWHDYRNGTDWDIYAQRLNSDGERQWISGSDSDGIAIAVHSGDQIDPVMAPDGFGGAIIAWQDGRSGPYSIYAQRVSSSGVVQWSANGIAVSTTGTSPVMVSDGSGGAVVAFLYSNHLYAQKINTAGVVQWSGSPAVAISTASSNQSAPAITSNSLGGAIIAWQNYASGTYYDIYAQRIDSDGGVHWTTNGVAICTASNYQKLPAIVYDGSGGAIIAWQDDRTDPTIEVTDTCDDIYAQRVDYSGAVQWTADGVPVCTAVHNQQLAVITSDENGGAIIAWQDRRGPGATNADIYAQHIDPFANQYWGTDGTPVSTHSLDQTSPVITRDGSGGALIAWTDQRDGNANIYAGRIFSDGSLPVEFSSFIVSPQGSDAKLRWSTATEVNNDGWDIERRTISDFGLSNADWTKIGFVGGSGTSTSPKQYLFVDHDPSPGLYAYRLKQMDRNGAYKYSKEVQVELASVPSAFSLSQNYPNPFNPTTTIRFSIAKLSIVDLKIYDLLGREEETLVDGPMEAGIHGVTFDATSLASGIYFYRLKAGSFTATKKLVLLK